MNTNFTKEDLNKIKHLIDTGITTKQEVADLNESFKETLNDVCEDLDLDKKLIRKAVTVAFKARQKGDKEEIIEAGRDELEEISFILDAIEKGVAS